MAAQNIALLYWTVSTILWGKVIADTDAEIAALQAFYQNDPNITVMLLPANQAHDDTSCRAAIAQSTHTPTPNDICAVVGLDNVVSALIRADATMIDAPQGHSLVNCPPSTRPGATYSPAGGLFANPPNQALPLPRRGSAPVA